MCWNFLNSGVLPLVQQYDKMSLNRIGVLRILADYGVAFFSLYFRALLPFGSRVFFKGMFGFKDEYSALPDHFNQK